MRELVCGVLMALCGGSAAHAAVQATSVEERAEIVEIIPQHAHQQQRQGALLVDVREDDERAQGFAEGALGVPLAELIAHPSRHLPDQQAEVLLICRSGQRSRRAAASLLQQGYTRVVSVTGGTLRWEAEGLPMQRPQAGTP